MTELPKNYDPKDLEGPIFDKWQSSGYFSRDAAGFANPELPPYTIVIPPPNVTGVLHMGHALNNTLQDILARRARMQGHPTRWIVGTDHAGIATQNKVEQKLASEGLTRFDIGREAFVEACWEWRNQYGSTIIEQLKGMGCSCDYNDEKFTMSPGYVRAIRRVFVKWYHNDLIYRGNRIINWCPRCTTALADDEVEHADEKGHLWYLRYPLVEPVDGCEYLVVATTRPETMLGDTGVAVNPNDERYSALIAAGARVRLPLVDREIPVFADDYVDATFGTGCVKVTPAHDPNDFDMGQRHSLDKLNVMDESAVINELGGRFVGMTREQAREAIVVAFEELGLLDHVEDHDHAVGHCYRCNTTIEPWLSEQWFVSMKPLAAPAIAAVRDGRVTFNPKRWENVYFHWMENIRDWCISRQLWWGHRIPVFYCDECGWQDALEEDIDTCPQCGALARQDEDVLDTWFSSQLWPFATQGWPDEPGSEQELDANYPTQVLSTARDIIFLWVARMIMSSMYFIDGGKQAPGAPGAVADGAIPFEDVLIHPTVLDKHGNIMSKSRGNGIDPVELIDEFGADAMRFGLAMQVTGSQDMKFDKDKLKIYRNFATKVWNASRFVLMNLEDFSIEERRVSPQPLSEADKWILSRLARLTAELVQNDEGYDFGATGRALYSFFWNEYCDWYIELSKGQLAQGGETRRATQENLVFVLDTALRLLHPVMPFVTERIWQSIPHGDARPSLMVAEWPANDTLASLIDAEAERSIDLLVTVVAAVRSVRARYRISSKEALDVTIKTGGDSAVDDAALLTGQQLLITTMANISNIAVAADAQKPAQSSVTISQGLEIYVALEGLVDLDAELKRLSAERGKVAADLQKLQKKLANENFLAKADPAIVEKTSQEAADLSAALEQIDQQLGSLN